MTRSSKAHAASDLKATVYWGDILYDTAICRPGEPVTVGRKPGNTFILDLERAVASENDRFQLLEVQRDRSAELIFDDQLDGHIRVGKELLSLRSARETKHVVRGADGKYRVRLAEPDRADVLIGHVSFYFDWVEPAAPLERGAIVDRWTVIFLLLLLLFGGGVIALVELLYDGAPIKPPERIVTIERRKLKTTPADVPVPATEAPSKAAMGAPQTRDGGAQKGAAGKVATKLPAKPSAAASLRKANLGSLVSGLTSVGANAPTAKPAAADAVEAPIEQAGTGGFTTEGLQQGGGGQTVGIGRTMGQGKGGFSGTGRLGLYGNSAVEGTGDGAGGGGTRVAGGLDRSVIESVIRRRLDRIRLCYERQLNFHPKLAGKISVRFVIGKAGEVQSSSIIEDTMKSSAVTDCVMAEVKSWNFPPPEGGTLVNVDYPFVFESSAKGGS